MKGKNTAQRGNVLFIIILGVILFAALIMAVNQNMTNGNQQLSETRLTVLADDIITTAATYEKAVQKLQAKGISENRISFTRASGDGYELTPASDATEQVFNIAGGGANYTQLAADVLDSTQSAQSNYGDWMFIGAMEVTGIGTDGSGATADELIAFLPYVRQDICKKINQRVGVTTANGDPPQENDTIKTDKYTGTFDAGDEDIGSVVSANLNGKKSGCFRGDTLVGGSDISDKYYFYYVLLPR